MEQNITELKEEQVRELDYVTRDMTMAAFVWSQENVELLAVEGSDPGGFSLQFRFKVGMDERKFAKLILDYANNKALVEPQKFVQKQNNVRDLLHNMKRERRQS
jgi:hypothetical protein